MDVLAGGICSEYEVGLQHRETNTSAILDQEQPKLLRLPGWSGQSQCQCQAVWTLD